MPKGSCAVTSVFNGLAQLHDLRQGEENDGRADRQGNFTGCGEDERMEPVFIEEVKPVSYTHL